MAGILCRVLLCGLLSAGSIDSKATDDVSSLRQRLVRVSDKEARRAQRDFPDGELFTWEFRALALENLADESTDDDDRFEAIEAARESIEKMDQVLRHRQFRTRRDLPVRGGIVFLGGRNLVLGRLVRLAGRDATAREEASFHADSQRLHDAFVSEPSGVPETYAGQHWPVDALFALESLKVHDAANGTHLSDEPIRRWVESMRTHRDRQTGLMPSKVSGAGLGLDLPRGCALSWSLAVLPRLDQEFASEQWAAYKRHFLLDLGGVTAFREYPPGRERRADVDSGPIIRGAGAAASGFAIAAARANGDASIEKNLRTTAGLVSQPPLSRLLPADVVPGPEGLRLVDALLLWAETVPTPAFVVDRDSPAHATVPSR